VCRAIAAALRYDAPDDPGAAAVQETVLRHGLRGALERVCGLEPDSPLIPLVEAADPGPPAGARH
jgi:mannitol-1-phosphate 5-dehydrogenase